MQLMKYIFKINILKEKEKRKMKMIKEEKKKKKKKKKFDKRIK